MGNGQAGAQDATGESATTQANTAATATPREPVLNRLWRQSLHRLRRQRLVECLLADRLLSAAFLVLGLAAVLPLFATPFLPLADLPANAAQGALMPDIIFKRGLAAYHYRVQWAPVPYWTTHVLVGVLSPVMGVLNAAKVMVALAVLGMPLAVMRVLLALGRDPRLAVLAFLLSWDNNLYAGWTAFLLSMIAALWGIAWLLEARTPRDAVPIGILSCLIGLTHIQGVAYFGLVVSLLFLLRRPWKRAAILHLIAGSGLAVSVLPWLFSRFSQSGGHVAFTFGFHTPREKLNSFFLYTLDNLPKVDDGFVTALAFSLLLFGVPVLCSLGEPSAPRPTGDDLAAPTATGAVLVLAPLALYFALPMSIDGPVGHWYTYPRYATFALVALLFLPRGRFTRWQVLWLLPGVLTALLMFTRISAQFADYGTRARPFLEIISHVRPNSAYLPLELDDSDPATRLETFNQIHSYIAGFKKGYDPHLFDNNSIPFLYRGNRRLPQTAWNRPQDFSLTEHGRYYDYVVVQGGLNRDPLKKLKPSDGMRARLVVEAGRFRLYEILKNGK
jgi:hypothetical protein